MHSKNDMVLCFRYINVTNIDHKFSFSAQYSAKPPIEYFHYMCKPIDIRVIDVSVCARKCVCVYERERALHSTMACRRVGYS